MGTGCLGAVCVKLCIKCLLGMHWAGNGRSSLSEPLSCDFRE